MADTHDCPGGCGARVPQHQLACKPDWYRLPAPLRRAVNDAYRRRAVDPRPHRAALRAALIWYRSSNNPARPPQPQGEDRGAHCQHHELPQPHAGPGPAFAADYPGRCSQCDDGIEPADLIRADGEGGYVHAGCIR